MKTKWTLDEIAGLLFRSNAKKEEFVDDRPTAPKTREEFLEVYGDDVLQVKSMGHHDYQAFTVRDLMEVMK